MNRPLKVPVDASAALYFLPGQYLFADLKESSVSLKALSSDQVARAFRKVHTDTGWLGRRVLRYREAPEGNAILSYEPAGVRRITIAFSAKGFVELSVPLPPLILLGKGREYYLIPTLPSLRCRMSVPVRSALEKTKFLRPILLLLAKCGN